MDLSAPIESGEIQLDKVPMNSTQLDQIVKVQYSPALSGLENCDVINFYQIAMIEAMNNLNKIWNSMKEKEIQVYKTRLEQMIADDMLDDPSTTTPYDIFIFENM